MQALPQGLAPAFGDQPDFKYSVRTYRHIVDHISRKEEQSLDKQRTQILDYTRPARARH